MKEEFAVFLEKTGFFPFLKKATPEDLADLLQDKLTVLLSVLEERTKSFVNGRPHHFSANAERNEWLPWLTKTIGKGNILRRQSRFHFQMLWALSTREIFHSEHCCTRTQLELNESRKPDKATQDFFLTHFDVEAFAWQLFWQRKRSSLVWGVTYWEGEERESARIPNASRLSLAVGKISDDFSIDKGFMMSYSRSFELTRTCPSGYHQNYTKGRPPEQQEEERSSTTDLQFAETTKHSSFDASVVKVCVSIAERLTQRLQSGFLSFFVEFCNLEKARKQTQFLLTFCACVVQR